MLFNTLLALYVVSNILNGGGCHDNFNIACTLFLCIAYGLNMIFAATSINIVSEYGQEIRQSQTADKLMAP